MARASRKHKTVQNLTMVFDAGLDRSDDERNIPDNALSECLNMIYTVGTKRLLTRPGLAYITNSVDPSGTLSQILGIYYYVKDANNSWLVAAADGNLYQMTYTVLTGLSPKWTLIGSLTDSTTKPSFLTFNGKLLIADGNTNIRTWDGTTYSTIADSPQATALAEINNRVVANDANDLDAVFFSGPEDETDWDTSGGSAVSVRAGYGDGLRVNGFGVLRDLLIVSKVGAAYSREKKLWSISAAGTASEWYSTSLSKTNAAISPHCMAGAVNDVFFVDSDGIQGIKGVIEFGDVQVDPSFGYKINREVASLTGFEACWVTSMASVWTLYDNSNRIFVYHPFVGSGAFTEVKYGKEMNSITEVGELVYIASNDGMLYRFDGSVATDELTDGNFTAITCRMRTKLFTFTGAKAVLRRIDPNLEYSIAGAGKLDVFDGGGITYYEIADLTLLDSTVSGYLYDATGYLADADMQLEASTIASITVKQRFRSNGIMFRIRTTSGAFGLVDMVANVALVSG